MAYNINYHHIVFRTHNSERSIAEDAEGELYRYIFTYCKGHGVKLWRVNSMPDHVHLFVSLPPSLAVATFVKNLKQTAGNFMRSHADAFPRFRGWAEGYCAISYSRREAPTVINYIRNQKVHHHRKTLAEEIEDMLLEAGITPNPEVLERLPR